MAVLHEIQAEMNERARALLQRLHERDKARGWPPVPIRWPGRSNRDLDCVRRPDPAERGKR